MVRFVIVTLFSLHLLGCSDNSIQSGMPANIPDSALGGDTIPRLGAGPHIGMITGFDVLTTDPYDQPSRVSDLISSAVSAGMNISRFQVDWSELETAPGMYDGVAMDELLLAVTSAALPAYITLSTLDTGTFTFPDYLMDGETLRGDLTLSSLEVTDALENFLDWFVPQLSAANVWGISIGNEGDGLLHDGVVNSEEFIAFFRKGLMRVNALDSELSSSVTFTGDGYFRFQNETRAILAVSDHATVNYYCLDAQLQATQENVWQSFLAELKQAVGTKTVFFQELGCPVGYGDDGMDAPIRPPNGLGSDPTLQARFIDYMGHIFINDPQFIGATWFQLLDWSPELAAAFADIIAQEGEPAAAALLEEWLATSGLCRWADGTCRSGWQQWLQTITAIQEERLSR